ncbi:MAG: potassium-transporting ATPase subunit KdpC [Propionibacteriaceae bacterium]|nr:potassium-transporting ATPase subunit KdpC [Propionibacteriaceae bacterium]
MALLRQLLTGARFLLLMTVLLGVVYPLAITGLAQVVFPVQANGSRLTAADGRVVGSALIGQAFDGPQWFHSRPSASDYSGQTSGGSNLSPASADQVAARAERRGTLEQANPDAVGPLPEDALTASASGLDPHISPAYAQWQAPRVARARGVPLARVQSLILVATELAPLRFLGQDAVNVARLNLLLANQ